MAIGSAADKKLEQLLHAMPDSPERRLKAKQLLDSRDQRLKELSELQKDYPKQVEKRFGSMDLLQVYRLFWQREAERDEACQPILAQTEALCQKKKAAREDLPALLTLAKGLYGLNVPDVRHLVIDEAQDVPPLQVKILREVFQHDAFTLVGDLCQGIGGDGGIRQWSELSSGIFRKPVEIVALSTAYRSTAEITEAALSVIGRHPVDRKKMAIVPDGRDALTYWKVIEPLKGATLLECRLTTGRTHQIRVHMTSIGHPLLGDPLYGPKKMPYPVTGGQLLPAFRIGFIHPRSGEEMLFEAPPEERFLKWQRKLKL
jgi:superfamily I DNA/RNA helicase